MRNLKILYTIDEACKVLDISKVEVNKLIKKGHLTALKLDRLKISGIELQRFINERKKLNFLDFDVRKEVMQ